MCDENAKLIARQESFGRITRMIASRDLASNVLHVIAGEARALTGAASAAVALIVQNEDLLEFVAVEGENADQLTGLRIRATDSFGEGSLRTGDVSISGSKVSGSHTTAVTPILRDEKAIGALFVLHRDGRVDVDEAEMGLLSVLADQASLTLINDDSERMLQAGERELAVLYDMTQTASGSLNMQDVVNCVLDTVCQHLEYQTAVLFLLNDERTHLFIAADRGLNDEDREIQLAPDGRVTERVLESGKPVLIANTEDEPDFEEITTHVRTRSAMIAPIRSRDENLGLVVVSSAQPDAYTPGDLKMLNAAAMQAGNALSNAWLYEDAMRREEEATAIYELSQHVNSTLNMDRVFQFVSQSVLNLLKVDKFALMLADEGQEKLVTRVSAGVDTELFSQVEPRIGEGIPGWVYEWMTPTAVSDVSADSRNRTYPIHQAGVTSAICVPMALGDDVIGVMLAMSSTRRLFTVAEMELLYTIANQASVAIVNAMLYQEARGKSAEMRRYFNRVARALGAAMESQSMPQLLANLAVEVFRAERSVIYRLENDNLHLHVSSGFRHSSQPDAILPLGEGLCGWVAKKGKSLTVSLLSADPRTLSHGWITKDHMMSYMGIPLKSGRKTVGVVGIYTQNPRIFQDDEVKLLTQFARRSGVAETLIATQNISDGEDVAGDKG